MCNRNSKKIDQRIQERNIETASSSSEIDWNESRGNDDLLSHLRRQAAGRHHEKEEDEGVWNPDSQRNPTYSISDISMSNKIANNKKMKTCGWKLVDGKRTYTTYRNGGVVQGHGAEAFKLSMGDAAPTKAKKIKSEAKENLLPDTNSNSSNTECDSKKIEVFQKGKVSNYENLPGNGDFDFSFG